ncbi:Glyoxalase-like domain [Chlamydia trachomatis]|nr:Glyoxalase-like domain [Chlamydia trachomatis]
MISKSTSMLYVSDTKDTLDFGVEKIGFVLLDTAEHPEATSYEIAPSKEAAFSFGIHDKNWVAASNPGMNVGFPSILLETADLEAEYTRLTEAGVATNPIMEYQGMVHFTFADNEGNYIAVKAS